MFNGMGIQWAGTLLGCVALALVPIPVCFYLFGRKLRERSKFSPTMMSKAVPEDEGESTEEEGAAVGTGTGAAVDGDANLRTTSTNRTGTTTNGDGAREKDLEKQA
jgi:MFS transporter, DHA1 family, multidrug resistance protein